MLSPRRPRAEALNCSLPQMIDRVGENYEVTQGIWNSLSSIIGAGSFDEANTTTPLGEPSTHRDQYLRLKTRYRGTLEALRKEPSLDSILALRIGFGGESKKLHKKLMDEVRERS